MADNVEEIKSRLDIVEILSEYIKMSPAGANFKACCPFHQEKSASFMVSPGKQIWHCFGCGEGGDIIKFIMKKEGLQFGEALKLLADKAGIKLERYQNEDKGQKNRLLEINEHASNFFHQALMKSDDASQAREYLVARGLQPITIDEFKLGYSLKDYDRLSQYLISKKYTPQEIIAAGLAVAKDRGYGLIDRFRDRLIIPIKNIFGQTVGFGGRILSLNDKMAKYINSPQTELYDKSRIIFGLEKAKNEIKNLDYVILVEGYMDFLACYQAGFKNTVACSGTALTLDQLKLLKRFTHNIIMAFDADLAGGKATERSIFLALQEGFNVKIVQLPKGPDGKPLYKDPDECIKNNIEAWRNSLKEARLIIEYFLEQLQIQYDFSKIDQKKLGFARILQILNLIPDKIEKDYWVKKIAAKFDVTESILRDLANPKNVDTYKSLSSNQSTKILDKAVSQNDLEVSIASILINYPELVVKIAQWVKKEMIVNEELSILYKDLLSLYNTNNQAELKDNFVQYLQQNQGIFSEDIKSMWQLLFDKDYATMEKEQIIEEVQSLAQRLKELYSKNERARLQKAMLKAESDKDFNLVAKLIKEFQDFNTLN